MEITKNNFLDHIDDISRDLKRSCFIGFDAEFSALLTGEKYKYRLFDTNEERYDLLKNEASKMIMTQVGLTIFQYERDMDTYVAVGYTFHLCPQAFGEIDQAFIFQASTLKFLCRHNFNFNKFIYEGIPYLSKAEEDKVRQQMKNGTLFNVLNRDLTIEDERTIQNHCSNVSKWLIQSQDGTMYLDVESSVMRYIIHNEIRLRFPEVLTTDSLAYAGAYGEPTTTKRPYARQNKKYVDIPSPKAVDAYNQQMGGVDILDSMLACDGNLSAARRLYEKRYVLGRPSARQLPSYAYLQIVRSYFARSVLIYRNKDVEGANNAPVSVLEENLLKYLLGFSQIISLLKTERKPIIGHNIFLDTVLLHNQFIGPLPQKYSVFKKNIHEAFPIMFDTKYISHEMRNSLAFNEVWKSNALQDLYEFFSEGKCKKLEHGVNLIRLSTPFDVKQSYHEAGWDSYCSGYCFIRLGHWAACENSGKYRPVGPREKIAGLAAHCNKVNVIRGAITYMNLAGEDPPSRRPSYLHVKSMKERVINIEKVVSALTGFGSVDVKPYGSRTALVATATQFTADKILKQFNGSKEYKISKFSVYKHSPLCRMALWGGALITGGLMLLFVHKKVK